MSDKTAPEWIEITSVGENTGEEYFGRFQVKPFLTLAERRDAQALAEKYNLGLSSYDSQLMYAQLAFLRFHIVGNDNVTWWKNNGLDLHDEEPTKAIANAIADVRERRNPALKKTETPTEAANEESKPEA